MGDTITTFKQVGDVLNLTVLAGQVKDGGQKMQSLTAEKVHGADGFEKHRRRRRHATLHDCIGDSFQEGEIIQRKSLLLWSNSKGMLQADFEPTDYLRQIVLRKRCHRQCRQVMEQKPEAIIGRGQRRVN